MRRMLSGACDRIRLGVEETAMKPPKRSPKTPPKIPPKTSPKAVVPDAEREKRIDKLLDLVEREVRERLGPDATFEERSDAGAEIMRDILRRRDDRDLQGQVTHDQVVELEGRRYGRLTQSSSATYYGPWGQHRVEEALYRELGVHNGPTIKPIELRAGMIARHMTPNLARIVGDLSAGCSSRELGATLRAVGMAPPSRAFLEKRVKQMAVEIADEVGNLEKIVRETSVVPAGVASVSCGLDRFSVRMSEEIDGESGSTPKPRRSEPYERTPPSPKEHHYRKAWVGSATLYDENGESLLTWRYGAEAEADPNGLAERVAADVAWALRDHPKIPVHCVQDAAPELRALPEALARTLPPATVVRDLVDFEHLVKDYLDEVVDTCEPKGDPNDMKGWYRSELLRDDRAIDRIWRNLRDKGDRLDGRDTAARDAVAAALRYIRKRKHKMRYASLYQANLPIGSGATEGTCWEMQRRVQRPGQSWQVPGLRGTLALRALVLSDRWDTAWKPYAAAHRSTIN